MCYKAKKSRPECNCIWEPSANGCKKKRKGGASGKRCSTRVQILCPQGAGHASASGSDCWSRVKLEFRRPIAISKAAWDRAMRNAISAALKWWPRPQLRVSFVDHTRWRTEPRNVFTRNIRPRPRPRESIFFLDSLSGSGDGLCSCRKIT